MQQFGFECAEVDDADGLVSGQVSCALAWIEQERSVAGFEGTAMRMPVEQHMAAFLRGALEFDGIVCHEDAARRKFPCERRVCELPTSDPEVFAEQIRKVKRLPQSAAP